TLEKGLAVRSTSIDIVNVPLPQWAGALLTQPETPEGVSRALGKLRRGSTTPGDLVLFVNGDRLSGTILALDDEKLEVQPLGAAKPISLERTGVQGVAIDATTLVYPVPEATHW